MSDVNVWDYFEKVIHTSDVKKSECRLCNKIFSYTSTTGNLKSHLRKQHPNEVPILLQRTPKSEEKSIRSRPHNLYIWEYFTIVDEAKKRAACTSCKREFSYKSSISNLKTHLLRAHVAQLEVCEDDEGEESPDSPRSIHTDPDAVYLNTDEENSDANDAEASPSGDVGFKYFTKEEDGRARCSLCGVRVPYSLTCFRAHMKESHPKNYSFKDHEADDAKPNVYQEVVYLYDSDSKTSKSPMKPLKLENPIKKEYRERARSKRIERILRCGSSTEDRKRRLSSPTENREGIRVFPSTQHTANNALDKELETFGNYITCLMKTIPKAVNTQLQMDIINLIITTKIKHENTVTCSAGTHNAVTTNEHGDSIFRRSPAVIVTIPDEDQDSEAVDGHLSKEHMESALLNSPSLIIEKNSENPDVPVLLDNAVDRDS